MAKAKMDFVTPDADEKHFDHRKLTSQLHPARLLDAANAFRKEAPTYVWSFFIEAFLIPSYRPEWLKFSTWLPQYYDPYQGKEQKLFDLDASTKKKKRRKTRQTILPTIPAPEPHNHSLCRTITINVSGRIYQPQLKSLLQFPNTLLGNPRRLAQFYDPVRDDYFIDRNRTCFDAIIYYYQSRGMLRRPYNISMEIFEDEVRFYDLGEQMIEKLRRDEGLIIEVERSIPRKLFQRKLWLLFEYPESSQQARVVAVVSILVIIISIFLFCMETVGEFQHHADNETEELLSDNNLHLSDPFFFAETICMCWFVFEFIVRALTAPGKAEFFKSISNLIDLVAILPYFVAVFMVHEKKSLNKTTSLTIVRVVRLVRVFRILKLSRHNRGLKILGKTLKASIRELGLLIVFLGIGVILFSSAVYFAELHHPNTHFKSIIGAFWWSVVTMTTCGYGDHVPQRIRWENILEFHWKHPRTGGKSLFLLNTSENVDKGKTALTTLTFEVLTMQQDTRSWFVENTIISDGNTYVCSPVDPLFFILPSLSKCEKAKPITDHLYESSLPRALADVLSKRLSHTQLSNVAIKKEFDDLVAFAYSEEKTLTWLSKKVEKVAKFLAEKEISQAESSVSSNFVKSSTDGICKDDCLRYASDIVGEYLEDGLKKKLLEKLGLPVILEKSGIKRKNVLGNEDENTSKKSKLADGDAVPLEDYGSSNPNTPVNKNAKVTAKEKVLQKAAQGSHSLFKFFAPKAK